MKTENGLFRSASQMIGADNYNDWTFHLFKQYISSDVLEIGCGTGSFTKRIIDLGGFNSLLSIDISEEAVNYCKLNYVSPLVEYRVADLLEVNSKFDLIVCMNVLEHINDDLVALQHLLSLLKPNGRLFLLVPAHQSVFNDFDIAAGHYRRYNKKSMSSLYNAVQLSGFSLDMYYFNTVGLLGYWFVYKLLKKNPVSGGSSEIGVFDKWIVPLMKRIEGKNAPFGISLISIFSRL